MEPSQGQSTKILQNQQLSLSYEVNFSKIFTTLNLGTSKIHIKNNANPSSFPKVLNNRMNLSLVRAET